MRRGLIVKNPWIWLWCLAAGIVVGFIVGRGWDEPAAARTSTLPETAGKPAVVRAPEGSPPADSSPSRNVIPAPAPVPSADPPPPASANPVPGAEKSWFAQPVDSGVINPIDTGEVFGKLIARPATADQPNELGDVHRALEREPRDDSWAYAMEGQLQNAMLNETSRGAFNMEHVECRTTMCEVRISGSDAQADAVRDWANALHAKDFSQQMLMNVSSTIASHGRIDAIFILRRPARTP